MSEGVKILVSVINEKMRSMRLVDTCLSSENCEGYSINQSLAPNYDVGANLTLEFSTTDV